MADTFYWQSKCRLFLVQTCFILHPLQRVRYQFTELWLKNQAIVAYEKMGLPLVHNPTLNMMFWWSWKTKRETGRKFAIFHWKLMISVCTLVGGKTSYSHKCTKIPWLLYWFSCYKVLKFCMLYSSAQTETKLLYGWVIGISVQWQISSKKSVRLGEND